MWEKCWVEMHVASSNATMDTLTLHRTQRRCQRSRPWTVQREIINGPVDGLVEKDNVDGGGNERLCRTGAFSYLLFRWGVTLRWGQSAAMCTRWGWIAEKKKNPCSVSEWCPYRPASLPNRKTPVQRPQPSCRSSPTGCVHVWASFFVQQASLSGRRRKKINLSFWKWPLFLFPFVR